MAEKKKVVCNELVIKTNGDAVFCEIFIDGVAQTFTKFNFELDIASRKIKVTGEDVIEDRDGKNHLIFNEIVFTSFLDVEPH